MRFSVSVLALLVASATHADDIITRADIAEATVYMGIAEVNRAASVTLPAGTHRLIVALPDAFNAEVPHFSSNADVIFGPPSLVQGIPISEGALDTAEQAAARAAVEAVEDAVQAAQDRIALADATIRAATLQLAYLEALARGGEDGADLPDDLSDLTAQIGAIGTETVRVAEELQAAQIARRELTDALEDRQIELNAAQQALSALRPFGTMVNGLAVEVIATVETKVDFVLEHLMGDVGWAPVYEMHLDSDSGALSIDRFIAFGVGTAELWRDVAVTFSAADPFRAHEPSRLYPRPARIEEPRPPAPSPTLRSVTEESEALSGLTQTLMEPVIIAEDTVDFAMLGLNVSYSYNRPVSIGTSGETLLPLDGLDFDAELAKRAVPRQDDTAFLMAEIDNDSGEPILPGEVIFFRDGGPIAEGYVEMIPAGAAEEFAFGPIDHIRLEWQDLSLDEGDRGVFVQSNIQDRRIRFSVENASDQVEEVHVLYATPFAEQEDLDVEVTLSLAPTEEDYDDLRGVMAWDITLEPGETQEIEMEVSLDWPDGQILTWRP